jgi:serine/threonine-protein kinase
MSLRVLDLKSGTQKLLVNEAAEGWYLPSGHLLYTRRNGTALVAPFDLNRLEVTGTGVPVFDRVLVLNGFAQLVWSLSGSAVYATGDSPNNETFMMRVSRDGAASLIDSGWVGRFTSLALAPDGRRLAVGAGSGAGDLNIWIKQLDRGPVTRLSFGGGDRRPAWSPDGRMVAFIRDTGSTSIVTGRYADGSRPDTTLFRLDRQVQEVEWSRDGKWLVGRTDNGNAGAGDLVGVRSGGDTTPVVLVASSFTELHPAISPDGRWLAYTSNESGNNEVYVRPFPNTNDGRWQASTAGGQTPRWSRDGRELFFIDGNFRMVAAQITASPSFAVGELRSLFSVAGYALDGFHQAYDVTPDGRSFIIAAPRQISATTRPPSFVRVDHWFRDLEARMKQ